MDAPHNQVFFPKAMQELFSSWARFPDAVPFAGGTELVRNQKGRFLSLPRNILSLDHLDELRRITRTERYLEIGAMVRINEVINLGKIVPQALTMTFRGIAGPSIRNLATIGGSICHSSRRLDAAAPLIALDARYELRTAAQSRWISASRFSSLPGPPAINPQELLTRVRIPLEQWDYTVYHKFRPAYSGDTSQGAAVFIVRIQKNILSDIRVVFAGQTILRDKNSETALAGKQLPLERKDARHFMELWEAYLSGIALSRGLMRVRILNFIESGILGLMD
jgi:CO/xanthine dehydrogenase FAD-binding subunit